MLPPPHAAAPLAWAPPRPTLPRLLIPHAKHAPVFHTRTLLTNQPTKHQPPTNPNENKGARTSFKVASGVRLADALARNKAALPEGFGEGLWCEKYEDRLIAATRTWLRPHSQDNLM
jgi:hypothetical protein